MLCEHQWITVLAGTAERIVETPLKVCAICGALKVGDKIVSPGLQIEEVPSEEIAPEETAPEEAAPEETAEES